jgi:ATP-binding protein involved in chromosome partitioning
MVVTAKGRIIMTDSREAMRTALGGIVDPSRGKKLDEVGAIRHYGVDEDGSTVKLLIEVGVKAPDITKEITRAAAKIVKLDHGFKSLVIEYEQKSVPSGAVVRHVVGVASGKGGVGKSTVTANLAYALRSLGRKVGVIDADVYGANLPVLFGIGDVELTGTPDEKIYPIEKDGIEVVSAAFLMEPGKALMWRGPMLTKVLKIFFEDTLWSPDLDYLLIDLPPGTGDVAMDVKNFAPDAKMLIVTTPHESASQVAIKAGYAARQLGQELIGVVENMAYFTADGKEYQVFGKDGGKTVAAKLGIPLVGRIPIAQPQSGHPSIFAETEENGMIYLAIARKVMRSFGD